MSANGNIGDGLDFTLEENAALDEFLARTTESALAALGKVIDVEAGLAEVLRSASGAQGNAR